MQFRSAPRRKKGHCFRDATASSAWTFVVNCNKCTRRKKILQKLATYNSGDRSFADSSWQMRLHTINYFGSNIFPNFCRRKSDGHEKIALHLHLRLRSTVGRDLKVKSMGSLLWTVLYGSAWIRRHRGSNITPTHNLVSCLPQNCPRKIIALSCYSHW